MDKFLGAINKGIKDMQKGLKTMQEDMQNVQLEPEVFHVGGKSFETERKLASGAFADVFRVRSSSSGAKFVAKKQLMNEHTEALVTREIKLMKKFDHRNLVRFLGAGKIADSAYVVIIMELCAGGALFDLLEKRRPKGPLTEAGVLKIFSDCVAGLKYMHDMNLAHWDIKLENILQGKDNVFKLCDFGSVVECPLPCSTPDQWGLLEDKIGKFTSESYRAPEMCDNFGVTELTVKTDVWALGSIFYACCFFVLPFMNQGKLGILNGKYTIPAGHKFSSGIISLIDRCFQLRPKLRADTNELAERILALQEGREPNIEAVAGSPSSSRASGNAEILEQRRARKAAAQARLDKKKGKKASRQSQQQQQQQQQKPAAAEVNFDVDWDNVAAPPTPKSGTPSSSQTEAAVAASEHDEKWNVEFEDDDDWGALASSSSAAAPSPAPAAVVETQSDDWVDWGNEASASPVGDEESSDAAPRKASMDAADNDDWDAFATTAASPTSGSGDLADDLFAELDGQPQQQGAAVPQPLFYARASSQGGGGGGRGGPNLNLMSPHQRQQYLLRMQQQQWQQQQMQAQQYGGGSAISSMLSPNAMKQGGQRGHQYRK